ncbi:MAG: CHAD domain-containing protein [Roseiflexaceae bacterium]
MATQPNIQLHLIDSAVAKRVLQRRTLLEYTIDAAHTQSVHTIYFDTPHRDVYHAQRSISLNLLTKEPQQLTWHNVTSHTPQHIDTYILNDRTWPHAVLAWLSTNNIQAHHLLPNAHYISKAYHRRILDQHGQELLHATFVQGILSTHNHNEPWDALLLTPMAHAPSQHIDAILEYIYQHIPHRIEQRDMWNQINLFLQDQSGTPTNDQSLIQHARVLTDMQRSADEALLIPMQYHDSLDNRRLVATMMRMQQQRNLLLEPFWVAFDDETHAHLKTLKPHTPYVHYTAVIPPIDIITLPFSEVLRLRIRSRLRSLLTREAEVLVGFSAYDVHRVRVILRKMRALLECGEGIYDAEVLSQFRRGFRRMARFLGEMRDCDAFSDHIRRILNVHQIPETFEIGLAKIRQKALNNFRELLTNNKHQQFLHQFAEFTTMPNSGNIVTIQSLPVVLTDRINAQQAHITKPHPKSLIKMDDDALHDLRIQIKHLRYLLESFSDVLLPAGDVALQRLIVIQDHLGTIQDAVVAQQLLTQMRLLNTPDGKRIIQTLRQEAAQQRQRLPEVWTTCQDDTFHESIAHAISSLKS